MNATSRHRALFALALAALLAASQSSADWAPNGSRIEDPDSLSNQYPHVGPGSLGGLLLGFGFSSRYCTLVLSHGKIAPGWPVEIRQGFGWASSPVRDGLAGVYVAIASPGHVIVRHFLYDGTPDPGWPAGGVEVCSAAGYKFAQAGSDAAGGVYVVWGDGRNSTSGLPREIYGTRVLGDGSIAPGWEAEGTLLAAAPESVTVRLGAPRPDGVGGMFAMTALAYYAFTPQERDDYHLVRAGPDGAPPAGWPPGGWASPDQSLAHQFDYEPDGSGGAYVTWIQPQGGTLGSRLLRLLSSGEAAPGWPAGGVPVVEDTTRLYFSKGLAEDGSGGVFVGAATDTGGSFPPAVTRIFRFEASGKRAAYWPADGRRLPEPPDPSPYFFTPLMLAADALGGVYAVWTQSPDENGDFATIAAIRLNPLGDPAAGWPEGGLPVCDTPGRRKDIQVVTDGSGTTYAVWNDHRPSDPEGRFFTYASRIDVLNRTLAVEPIALPTIPLRAGPNPFVGTVGLRLTLAEAGSVRLDVVDLGGRIVRRVANEWLAAGAYTRAWDGRTDAGSEAPTGLYFVRGSIGGRTVGVRLVRIR